MARRTIHARRASPYLLYLVIAFSILTVVCAIGWAWTYSLKNQVEISVFGVDRLQNAPEGTEGLFNEVFTKYQSQGPLVDLLDAKVKIADEYGASVKDLSGRLVGDSFTLQQGPQLRQSVSDILKISADVMKLAKDTLDASQTPPTDIKLTNMQESIRLLAQRIDALVLQVKQDATAATSLEAQIKGLQEELAAAKALQAQQVAQLQANLNDEKGRLSTARDSALAVAKQTEDRNRQLQDQLLEERRKFAAEKEKLDRSILTLKNNLKDLGQEIAEFRQPPTETGVDGHIIRVAEQGGVAYGDLNKKDGVLLGMTFSIFGSTELGKTAPQPKAQCRIVKIMQDSCELRIYEIQSNNPVVPGDVLVNPVYDRERRLRFTLVGKMDIEHNGTDQTEQLKALIQEFGGRVDKDLSVQTDYLVVGEEPVVPASPAAGASPQERQAYEYARKKFIDYSKARADAENFSIPILSLNRFLGLVGIAGQL